MRKEDREEYIQLFLQKHIHAVMLAKGTEYSRGEADINSNFKRVGEASGHTPEQTCLVYLLKHIDSISKAVRTGKFEEMTEPLEERIGDCINYLLILGSLVKEGRDSKVRLSKELQEEKDKTAKDPRKHYYPEADAVPVTNRAMAAAKEYKRALSDQKADKGSFIG